MSVAYGSPLTSANTNAAFVSRTVDTSMQGKLDNQNSTDATSSTDGAIHTDGGLGVEKSVYVGDDLTIESLAGNKALASSALGQIVESDTTDTELDYVHGVTAPIQNQIDNKADDGSVVHKAGTETITGLKTFSAKVVASGDMDVGGNVKILGNLEIDGTTTTINTANLNVTDTNITVNKNGTDIQSEGAGLTIDRTSTKGSFIYANALGSRFKAGDLGSESEVITSSPTQTMSGAKTFSNKINANNELNLAETINSSATGANALISTVTPSIRLTNVSLTSIQNIDDVTNGKVVVITNDTGSTITVKNNGGGTTIKQILTGSGADLSLSNNSTIIVSYDSSNARWMVIGGTGAATGEAGSVSIGSGLQTKSIVYTTTFLTTPSPVFSVTNLTDSDPIWLQGIITAKSTTGFTVYFNAPTDTANYLIEYHARN